MQNSCVGQDSIVEGGVKVIDSLILTSCLVLKGACIEGSIVGDRCLIGEGVTLKDCVLGDNVNVKGPASLVGRTLEG